VSITVTWTKLFAYTGTLLAACYGVAAYVAGGVESRLAAWTSTLDRVAAQQQALGDGLAALRQAIEAEQARAAADAERRTQATAEALAAAESRVSDRLKALESAVALQREPAPATPAPGPAAAPPAGAAAPP
jgi:hypothetical protein